MILVHLILLLLFIAVAIFGLIFGVDEGVFIGLALGPWQLKMVLAGFGKKNNLLMTIAIGISTALGLIYFLMNTRWLMVLGLLGIEGFLYLMVMKDKLLAVKQEGSNQSKS